MPDNTNGNEMSLSAGMATFSGYMAFSGRVLGSGVSTIGVIFSVADGVITGAFDKHGNPDKSFDRIIGTAVMAWASAELGAISGSKIGAIIGTTMPGVGTTAGTLIGGVIGAVSGAVVGGLYGSQAYDFYVDKYNEFGNFLANGIIEAGNMTIEGFGKLLDMADSLSDFIGNTIDEAMKPNNNLPLYLDHHSTIPDNLSNPFGNVIQYDPLALDLDNDGKISIIPQQESSVYFDHDGDGVGFRSSWIGSQDGLLVYDKNNNGTIDNGNELFGNFTLNSNGEFASNGYEALANLDSDNNGIINENDTEFTNLKVWQDSNSNGISESNELKSLSEFNIESLNLNNFTNLNLFVA